MPKHGALIVAVGVAGLTRAITFPRTGATLVVSRGLEPHVIETNELGNGRAHQLSCPLRALA
jgi:hypothetical protein